MKTVIIIGVGRSGTSLLASLLYSLGVNMGKKKHLLRISRGNPRGYYENLDLVQLNKKIIDKAGGTWYDPPSKESVWKIRKKFAPDIMNFVEKYKSSLWGFKDPRTVYTFDIFKEYLKSVHLLVTIRDKDAVIQSMINRTGTLSSLKGNNQDAIEKIYTNLYNIYSARVSEILKEDYPIFQVEFERFFYDYRQLVEEICVFLGLKLRYPSVVDLSLKHQEFEELEWKRKG